MALKQDGFRGQPRTAPPWFRVATEVATELYPDDAVKAFDEMRRIKCLMEDIEHANRSIRRIEEDRQAAIDKHLAEINDAQSRCQHERTKFHPDPSGNNDSHRKCLICGKYL